MDPIILGIKCKADEKGNPAVGWDVEVCDPKTGEHPIGLISVDVRIRARELVEATLEI